MLLVAPEVVVVVADLRDHGDLRVGIEHLEDARIEGLEILAFRVLGDGLGVARLDPFQRLGAVDVVEPEVFIIGAGFDGGRGGLGRFVGLGHATEGKGDGQRNPASMHGS